MLVLCAKGYEPPASAFPGVEVVYALNQDTFNGVSREQLAVAIHAARDVAAAVRAGRKVLVTCWAGLNRSGLVSALALHLLTGRSGSWCIGAVQHGRQHALGNPAFVAALGKLKHRAFQLSEIPLPFVLRV